jgi:glycerate kinase
MAIIEMATAAGIQLIKADERNPLKTTTYGVGELIIDVLDRGIREFIIAIGGSATNEGGIGLASALGVKFLDQNNNDIELNGKGLKNLVSIDISGIDKRIEISNCM